MPIKRVQFPDGSIHSIEVPEGATNEQIIAFVQSQHPAAQASANNSDIANLVAGKHKKTAVEQFRDNLRLMPHGGLASGIIDAADATQHHIVDSLSGLGQLGAHGLEWGLDKLGLDSFAAQQHAVNVKNDAHLRKREASYQARTPDGVGSYSGAAVGEALPWMYGAGELRALGMLPKVAKGEGLLGKAAEIAKKGGLLALEGGAMGATSPVLEPIDDYASTKAQQIGIGALAAPLLAGTLHAGGKGIQGLGWLANYAYAAGREVVADARLDKLLNADPRLLRGGRRVNGVWEDDATRLGIDGYSPTPAQVLKTPEAVQAERILRNNGASAPAFAARESANNAALREHVASVAGDDAAMEAARQARRDAVANYRTANLPEVGSPMVDAPEVLSSLERLSLSANPTIRGAAREHLSLLKKQMDEAGRVPAYALDDIRQNAGTMLAKHTPARGSSPEAAKYGPVTDSIAQTLERAVPGYRDYLATYARASAPINDMEAGRALLGAIDSGARDAGGNQGVNLAPVKALLKKDNAADFPMSPDARAKIDAVMEAVQNRSVANNNIAAAGPGTAADAARAMSASPLLLRALDHSASGMGGLLGYGLGDSPGALLGLLAGGYAKEGVHSLNNQVAKRVGEKAANARLAADAIEANRLRLAGKKKKGLLDLLLPYDDQLLLP